MIRSWTSDWFSPGRREADADRGDEGGKARAGRGVGDEGARDVGVGTRPPTRILEGHGLNGVVEAAIDVSQVVRHGDIWRAGRVDVDHEVRRPGGARTLERDDGIGKAIELGDATSRQRTAPGRR